MKKRILICDDEEGVRESLKLILEKDYDVEFAETGDIAIKKAKVYPYDLVILDLKMPKKDGFETLKELRKVNPSFNIVIASGYKSVDTAQEACRLGAADYIIKPFDSKVVIKAIKNICPK